MDGGVHGELGFEDDLTPDPKYRFETYRPVGAQALGNGSFQEYQRAIFSPDLDQQPLSNRASVVGGNVTRASIASQRRSMGLGIGPNEQSGGSSSSKDPPPLLSGISQQEAALKKQQDRLIEQVNQMRKKKRVIQDNPIADPYAAYVDGCRSKFFSLYTL